MVEQAQNLPRGAAGRGRRWLAAALVLLVVVAAGGWLWWLRAHSVAGVWRGELLPGTQVTVRLDGGGKAYAKLALAGRDVGGVALGEWKGSNRDFTLTLEHSIPFVTHVYRCRVLERQPNALKVAVNDGDPQTWQRLPDDALLPPGEASRR